MFIFLKTTLKREKLLIDLSVNLRGRGRMFGIIGPRDQTTTVGGENPEVGETALLEEKLHRGGQDSQAVLDAAAEIDGGGLFEIAGGTGDLTEGEAKIDHLGQHFVIKHEVIGVFPKGQAFQDLAGEGPEAGVILGEFGPQQQILKQGEEAVEEIFVRRHAPLPGLAAQDAGADGCLVFAAGHQTGQGRDDFGRVLVIGMQHDHDVGRGFQSLGVAGLLVAAIAHIAFVQETTDPQTPGHL